VERSYARTRLKGGEILIGVVGSIGKLGIAPPSWAGANIARAVCRIAPGPDVNVKYLTYFLSDRMTQTYFAEVTRTLAQPTLNVGQLERTPIRLPPLPMQEAIVAELDALHITLDSVKALQDETATELDALLPAILDRAFKGEL
jgi:type I restriction enzyme S subunit